MSDCNRIGNELYTHFANLRRMFMSKRFYENPQSLLFLITKSYTTTYCELQKRTRKFDLYMSNYLFPIFHHYISVLIYLVPDNMYN